MFSVRRQPRAKSGSHSVAGLSAIAALTKTLPGTVPEPIWGLALIFASRLIFPAAPMMPGVPQALTDRICVFRPENRKNLTESGVGA